MFLHISTVERAGLGSLAEGQKVSYEITTERGKAAAANLKAAIERALAELAPMSTSQLIEHRYEKFRKMGSFFEE